MRRSSWRWLSFHSLPRARAWLGNPLPLRQPRGCGGQCGPRTSGCERSRGQSPDRVRGRQCEARCRTRRRQRPHRSRQRCRRDCGRWCRCRWTAMDEVRGRARRRPRRQARRGTPARAPAPGSGSRVGSVWQAVQGAARPFPPSPSGAAARVLDEVDEVCRHRPR